MLIKWTKVSDVSSSRSANGFITGKCFLNSSNNVADTLNLGEKNGWSSMMIQSWEELKDHSMSLQQFVRMVLGLVKTTPLFKF